MNTHIYKEMCPDYYVKAPSLAEFKSQIRCLTSRSKKQYRYVDEKDGFKGVGLSEKIWQTVRGFFGFVDHTKSVVVKSEALKLLHYGKIKGYLNDQDVRTLLEKGMPPKDGKKSKLGKTVSKVIQAILGNDKTQASLPFLQKTLVDFHEKHREDLNPGFGYSLFYTPEVPALNEPHRFGSTYLHLANQVVNRQYGLTVKEIRNKALDYYELANEVKNSNEIFQKEFRNQFKSFVRRHWSTQDHGPLNRDQGLMGLYNWWNSLGEKNRIHKLIHTLVSTAHRQGHVQIVEEYAHFGLDYFPDDLQFITFKCLAQVKQKKFLQAPIYTNQLILRANQLEVALKDSTDKEASQSNRSQLKEIYVCLGEIYTYLKETAKASTYHLKAWELDTSDKELEVKLFNGFMMAAEKEKKNSESMFGWVKSWFGNSQQGLEYTKEASRFITAIKIEDLQRLIANFESHAQYDKAIQFYEFGINKWPESKSQFTLSPQTYYHYGLMQKDNQRRVEAFQLFEKALQLNPKYNECYKELLELSLNMCADYLKENQLSMAQYYYKFALSRLPSEAQKKKIHQDLANISVQLARHQVQKCQDMQEEGELSVESINKRADILKLALKGYNEALAYAPADAQIYFEKAELLENYAMTEEHSVVSYKAAAQLQPDNYSYLLRYSEVYLKQLEDANTRNSMISIIKSTDLQWIITSFEKHLQYKKAIQFYEELVRKLPEQKSQVSVSPQTYYQYGLIKKESGNRVEAYNLLKKAHQLDLDNKQFVKELLELSLQLAEENIQNAKRGVAHHYLKQALGWNPSEAQKQQIQQHITTLVNTCMALANQYVQQCLIPDKISHTMMFQKQREHKQDCAETLKLALKAYNEALIYDPTNARIYFDKASLLDFFEMTDENALEFYELAVKYKPQNYFYLMRLGEMYRDRKDEERADKYNNLGMSTYQDQIEVYMHWYDDRFLENKHYNIDPHTGWLAGDKSSL